MARKNSLSPTCGLPAAVSSDHVRPPRPPFSRRDAIRILVHRRWRTFRFEVQGCIPKEPSPLACPLTAPIPSPFELRRYPSDSAGRLVDSLRLTLLPLPGSSSEAADVLGGPR